MARYPETYNALAKEEREALIAQGWTPPAVKPPVDLDWAEVEAIEKEHAWEDRGYIGFLCLKRGRELERADNSATLTGWPRVTKPKIDVDDFAV